MTTLKLIEAERWRLHNTVIDCAIALERVLHGYDALNQPAAQRALRQLGSALQELQQYKESLKEPAEEGRC